jgi:hypothetical protein
LKLELVSVLEDYLKSRSVKSTIFDLLLNLVKKLKVEENGTLRPNDFDEKGCFEFLLMIVDLLFKSDFALNNENNSSLIRQSDEQMVNLVLRLLKNNDNSMNAYDDSFYQACLLQSLLCTTSSLHFQTILQEVLRFLMIDHFNPSRKRYLVHTIFQGLAKFIIQNLRSSKHHAFATASKAKKFKTLIINSDNPLLKKVFSYLQQLKKRYRSNAAVAPYIFLHKIAIKKYLKNYKLFDLLVYTLKYVIQERQTYGKIVANQIIGKTIQYFRSEEEELKKVQSDITKDASSLLSNILWEQMNSKICREDPQFGLHMQELYHLFFGEFIPCHLISEKADLFQVDEYWMKYFPRFNLDSFFLREKKYVVFKYLSLQKKKKNGQVVTPPRNHKYNIRDLLLQNFKVNKESFTKKNMAKHIVSILLTEKITNDVETRIINEGLNDKSSKHYKLFSN